VLDAAAKHGASTRCVWLDTPLAQAQVNLVERLLDRYGSLPEPEELRVLARTDQGTLAPTSQMRTLRELEPPSLDEGFADVDHVSFVRARWPARTRAGVFVAAAVLRQPGWQEAIATCDPTAPHLVFDWRPGGETEDAAVLAAEVSGRVESAVCPHPAGPPICWCRPPLPGLPLAFARKHAVDPARSTVVGASAAHRTLATTLGAHYVELGSSPDSD
jgi:hypothetical protein